MRRYVLRAALPALLFCMPRPAAAQTLDPEDYDYPVRGVKGYCSANFGEMRPDHFHSGIDIKTDGVEGKPLVAVADGCVSRIGVTAGGYGRALYLALDNGVTAVYGHISRFRDDLEEYVLAERLRMQRNEVQLYPDSGRFRVRRGEVIAFSGDSGTSYGPHLHFELRDTPTQRALNLVRRGVIRPEDTVPPLIVRLHYIETDTLDGVAVRAAPQSYDAVRVDSATYRLVRREPLEAGRNGFFVVEASDRRNGVRNTFGLYRMCLSVEEEPLFEYRMDGFTFDQSRYCNTAAWYPLQLASRNEAICLALTEGGTDRFCTAVRNLGVLRLAPGERRRLRIEAEDDCGNISHLEFTVEGRDSSFRAVRDTTLTTLCRRIARTIRIGPGLTARIPAGALYESCFCRPEVRKTELPADTTVTVLSPVYRILDPTVPLHREVTVSIRADVPRRLRPHATLATLDRRGRLACVGGAYSDGAVTARTRTTGDLLVVADTAAPILRPLFRSGSDQSRAEELGFRIGDDFSGIASCSVWIDGVWTPCDRYPVKGELRVRLVARPSASRHAIRVSIDDNCGNRTEWEGEFYR